MVTVSETARVEFERRPPTERVDVQEIVRGILLAQAKFAAAERLPLQRGTHAKGVCAHAVFEVFDLSAAPDPSLAGRLARGIFAHPGRYPAVVRFANASSAVRSDAKRDVRALSFSIDVPPGLLGAAVTRLDFSMNNAPTFPINDAHAFACLVRVLNAGSAMKQVAALWSLSLRELLVLLGTAARGGLQTLQPVRPYQTERYWSNVPFRHGADEAIKYSAIPAADNPAHPLGTGPDCLRDELVRHLRDDSQMAAFDFGLQLLDAGMMTRWGAKRDVTYWVENASVEWKESQAPFHLVGRLTLLPKSQLSDDEAAAMYIDVTEHSTPDSAPIGSINRARWSAEAASRHARMTGAADIPAPVPTRRSPIGRALRWTTVAIVGLLAARLVVSWWYAAGAAANLPPIETVNEVRLVDQGWGAQLDSPDRQLYYYTAQGASMHGIRYSWFINLERPFRTGRFADADHLRQLRFIVDPFPTRGNPDQLPVGFARKYDDTVHDYLVDVTCAACHTGQLNIVRDGRVTALRIDGGQAMNAFTDISRGSFQVELGAAFGETLVNPFKFNRFARNVLGPGSSWSSRSRLWIDMSRVFAQLVKAGRGSLAPHWYPTQEGFGRTDALARIANTVFGDHLDSKNYHTGDGPVNFPYLWNIWKFDWVQYNASVSQPMARNVGEVMGTGATYQLLDEYGRPIPQAERYRTTIAFENLQRIETTLQKLQPPAWPTDLLGGINQSRVTRGRALFNEHCVGCHGPHPASDAFAHDLSPLRGPADPVWQIRWKSVDDVGTDPNTAVNFLKNRVDISRSGLDPAEVRQMLGSELETKKARDAALIASLKDEAARLTKSAAPKASIDDVNEQLEYATQSYQGTMDAIDSLGKLDLRSVAIGEGLTVFGSIIRNRYFEDNHFSDAARACFEGFGTLDLPQGVPGYKPRPLKGVWATPPFLHNGSVPTIYALLSPREERPARFYVGTRQYDPQNLGYVTTAPAQGGGFWYDTTLSGNRNIGHEFRKGYVPFDDTKPAEAQYQHGVIGPELTPEERYSIIEYLKVGPDEPASAIPFVPANCFALLGDRQAQR